MEFLIIKSRAMTSACPRSAGLFAGLLWMKSLSPLFPVGGGRGGGGAVVTND